MEIHAHLEKNMVDSGEDEDNTQTRDPTTLMRTHTF